MTYRSDFSYKATRPKDETTWHGVVVSHVGNGRRVTASGNTADEAMENAQRVLEADLRAGGTPVEREAYGIDPPAPEPAE